MDKEANNPKSAVDTPVGKGESHGKPIQEQSHVTKEVNDIEDKTIALIYDELQQGLEIQRASLESIQAKAATILGFSGAIFALVFTGIQNFTFASTVQTLIFTSISASGISTIFAMLAFWTKRLRIDPNPVNLLYNYYDKQEVDVLKQLAVNKADAYNANHIVIDRAGLAIRIALLAQVTSSVFLALAIILNITT